MATTVTVAVQVTPKARENTLSQSDADGVLHARVTAAPEDGRANAAVCRLVADHYGVPPSAVQVWRGQTSRKKLLRVHLP